MLYCVSSTVADPELALSKSLLSRLLSSMHISAAFYGEMNESSFLAVRPGGLKPYCERRVLGFGLLAMRIYGTLTLLCVELSFKMRLSTCFYLKGWATSTLALVEELCSFGIMLTSQVTG